MNWKNFVDHFEPATWVLSVEKTPEGGCGTVRIVDANEKYIDALALAAGGVDIDSDEKAEFVPNSEYTRYIPEDLNFEDVCYKAAILKEPIHNFLSASRYPFDLVVFIMPMESDDDRIGYCTFTQVLLPKSDGNLMLQTYSQETAMEVINTCIKLRENKPFREIMQTVVEETRVICDADYCSVLLLDEGQRKCSVLGQAKAADSNLNWDTSYKDDDFYELAETWLDTMAGSFCLVVRDERDMEYVRERNPRWYQSLKKNGVERLVLFPLITHGQFLGYIMAINFDVDNYQHIKDTLELTTFFIASEIASNRFIDQLQELNRTDALTGVMNRNAMNARISALEESSSDEPCNMGLVFADMNGLKRVNDGLGHLAGDQLLKNAAMVLKSSFVGDEIYRAGGDEFLVLLQETSEADIQHKIADIKKKSELFPNVNFAVGFCLLNSGRDIRKALAYADDGMYADKASFYRMNPDEKRRQ